MNTLGTAANALMLHVGSGLGTLCRYDWRRKAHDGQRYSEGLLLRLVKRNRGTEFGREHDFGRVTSVRDYQDIVPLTTYEDYEGYIERMLTNGEQQLITKSKVRFFAGSSGTTGKAKYIPQTVEALIPYVKFVMCVATDLCASLHSSDVCPFSARGVIVTEISQKPAYEELPGHAKAKMPIGCVSSFGSSAFRMLFPLFTPLPLSLVGNPEVADLKYFKARLNLQDRNLKFFGGTYMSFLTDLVTYIQENHDMLIRDIETGAIDRSVELPDRLRRKLERKLRPDPTRATELRRVFEDASETALVSRIWQKMSFVTAVGTGDFAPFARRMQALCREGVSFNNSAYCASEAFFGMVMDTNTKEYLLLPDTGFFEFLPIPEECPKMPDRPLLSHELEIGKHYEIIVTNRSGLYRYRIYDVIRVVGYEGDFPYIEFAYRSTFYTDLCSTHITAEQTARAVQAAEEAVGVRVEEYSLYGDAEHVKPRIELFLETERMLTAQELVRMAQAYQDKMMEVADYAYTFDMGAMDPPVLRLVAKNTYTRHRDEQIARGVLGNQLKALRAIKKPEDLAFLRSAVVEPVPDTEQM